MATEPASAPLWFGGGGLLGLTVLLGALFLLVLFLGPFLLAQPPRAPPSLTTRNTFLNSNDTNTAAFRRRRLRRGGSWSDEDEKDGAEDRWEVERGWKMRPIPDSVKGCLKVPPTTLSLPTSPTPPPELPTASASAPVSGSTTPVLNSTTSRKRVRIVPPASEIQTMVALREYWHQVASENEVGVWNGIGGYRRTKDIYMKGQGGTDKEDLEGMEEGEKDSTVEGEGEGTGRANGNLPTSAMDESITETAPSAFTGPFPLLSHLDLTNRARSTSLPRSLAPPSLAPPSLAQGRSSSPSFIARNASPASGTRRRRVLSLSAGSTKPGDLATSTASERPASRWTKNKPTKSTSLASSTLDADPTNESAVDDGRESEFEDCSDGGSGSSTPTSERSPLLMTSILPPLSPISPTPSSSELPPRQPTRVAVYPTPKSSSESMPISPPRTPPPPPLELSRRGSEDSLTLAHEMGIGRNLMVV